MHHVIFHGLIEMTDETNALQQILVFLQKLMHHVIFHGLIEMTDETNALQQILVM